MSAMEGGQQPGKTAPWQLAPGAPQKPDFASYRNRIRQLVDERRQFIVEIKELQTSARSNPASEIHANELKACHEALDAIDAKRKSELKLRSEKAAEISALRTEKNAKMEKVRSVKMSLTGFNTVSEIDEAIDYVMSRMERGRGGLEEEKRTAQKLQALNNAKALLHGLQPLIDEVSAISEQEVDLQKEYLEIHERVGVLNKEYEEKLQHKRAVGKEGHQWGAQRSEIYKKCDEIRSRIEDINKELDTTSAERSKVTEEWEAWNAEAKLKYFAKIEAEREARRKAMEERKNAQILAEKQARAARRQNPYLMEISACGTLLQYLKEKKIMVQRDEEERKRREATSHFDPTEVAPAGCIVLNESKWSNPKPLSKAAKKQQQQKQQQQQKVEEQKAAESKQSNKDHLLKHPANMIRLFQMIDIEPPLSLSSLDEKAQLIKEKQQKYNDLIQSGELELSSDHEDNDEELHQDPDDTAEVKTDEPEAATEDAAPDAQATVEASE